MEHALHDTIKQSMCLHAQVPLLNLRKEMIGSGQALKQCNAAARLSNIWLLDLRGPRQCGKGRLLVISLCSEARGCWLGRRRRAWDDGAREELLDERDHALAQDAAAVAQIQGLRQDLHL